LSNLEQHIKRVNEKLQQLLKDYQQLQKDNLRQSVLIEELKKAKESGTHQIETLKEQVGILKAAAGRMNEADKKEFEKNINRYIRDIDKCIGILSE
jgi:DNA repair exonuclease SbcCD ATPase subunit